MILGIAMIGALIGFLLFNWFPAKIFGGDSLTLMIGANLAVMSIIGNMETIGVIIMVLFFVEFLIKAKYKFQSECFGIPQNGILFHKRKRINYPIHFINKTNERTKCYHNNFINTNTNLYYSFHNIFGGRI